VGTRCTSVSCRSNRTAWAAALIRSAAYPRAPGTEASPSQAQLARPSLRHPITSRTFGGPYLLSRPAPDEKTDKRRSHRTNRDMWSPGTPK
jgi:hypothetical protein